MKAAILCPGPSVNDFPRHWRDYDLRLGVNRTPLCFAVDWWVATDDRILKTFRPPYVPKLFTQKETEYRLSKQPDFRIKPTMLYESLFDEFPNTGHWCEVHGLTESERRCCELGGKHNWSFLSATAALVLAAHLGATQIDIFGADWKGTGDWDGFEYDYPGEEAHRTRNAERWETREKPCWNRWVAKLKARGIEVNRLAAN
jgi:hypothetical protein